jgi:hypothetical protein
LINPFTQFHWKTDLAIKIYTLFYMCIFLELVGKERENRKEEGETG